MSFDYEPMTEEECQKAKEFELLPDGIYEFVVVEAKPKYSSAGNSMIALKLVIEFEGKEFNVFPFLIATKRWGFLTKHFCEAVGLEKEYASRQFHADMALDRRGKAIISTDPAKPKNDGSGGMYNAKNKVDDFVAVNKVNTNNPFAPAPVQTAPPPITKDTFDSDIPF